jgi:hypothetical protein
MATWNTSNVSSPGNTSHAEHQFIHWLDSRPDEKARLEGITINLFKRSPCSECGPELAQVLNEVKRMRKGQPVRADIYWTQLHSSGAQPTSWQSLHEMQRAGWVLHAPADALPPEKGGYHAEQVHVKLI